MSANTTGKVNSDFATLDAKSLHEILDNCRDVPPNMSRSDLNVMVRSIRDKLWGLTFDNKGSVADDWFNTISKVQLARENFTPDRLNVPMALEAQGSRGHQFYKAMYQLSGEYQESLGARSIADQQAKDSASTRDSKQTAESVSANSNDQERAFEDTAITDRDDADKPLPAEQRPDFGYRFSDEDLAVYVRDHRATLESLRPNMVRLRSVAQARSIPVRRAKQGAQSTQEEPVMQSNQTDWDKATSMGFLLKDTQELDDLATEFAEIRAMHSPQLGTSPIPIESKIAPTEDLSHEDAFRLVIENTVRMGTLGRSVNHVAGVIDGSVKIFWEGGE